MCSQISPLFYFAVLVEQPNYSRQTLPLFPYYSKRTITFVHFIINKQNILSQTLNYVLLSCFLPVESLLTPLMLGRLNVIPNDTAFQAQLLAARRTKKMTIGHYERFLLELPNPLAGRSALWI